eukprot:TRINITY_DN3947_c0_g1_i1.p1 TRINITY_DN3947_c0_g1~~TRINITY_DN3947_c0_g1_i1.p1  ORF type:complete len:971 (+),score=131.83 TRINITY_DN3947_c0_g1_i1:87-2999(+)
MEDFSREEPFSLHNLNASYNSSSDSVHSSSSRRGSRDFYNSSREFHNSSREFHPSTQPPEPATPVGNAGQEPPEDDAQEDICRVCRCGSEPDRPLFYPCKCSGSIKYIHQDCLLTWLSHSKIKYCELCKTKYTFTPLYAPDTPTQLPLSDVIIAGIRRSSRSVEVISRLMSVIFVWAVLVPLGTAWIWKFFFGSVGTGTEIAEMTSHFSLRSIASDCFFGFGLSAGIIMLILGISSLLEYLQAHFFENQENRPENPDENPLGMLGGILGNNNQAVNDPANPDPANDAIELEEFVGLTGPISALFSKAVVVLTCFGGFLAVVVLIPKTVGKLALFLGRNTLGYSSILQGLNRRNETSRLWNVSIANESLAILNESQPIENITISSETIRLNDTEAATYLKNVTRDDNAAFILLVGYFVIIVGACGWLISLYLSLQRQRRQQDPPQRQAPLRQLIDFICTFVKVAFFIGIEGGAFPLGAGYLITSCASEMFQIGLEPNEQIAYSFRYLPILSAFFKWVVGLTYMFVFATFISWLREMLRNDVMWFFRNPNDPAFDPLKEMIEHSVLKHTRRIMVSVLLYGVVLLLLLYAPIQASLKLFPGVLPLNVWFRELYEVPLDLICFHVVIPFTVENWRPSNVLYDFIFWWLKAVGRALDLQDYLFGDEAANRPGNAEAQPNAEVGPNGAEAGPEAPVPPLIYKPTGFGFRIFVLLLLGTLTLFTMNLAFITLPVTIGRSIFLAIFGVRVSDIYTFTLGLYLIWGVAFLIRCTYNTLVSDPEGLGRIIQYSVVGFKWAILLSIWLLAIPFFLGLLFELTLVIPLRCPHDETPHFFTLHGWALGLVLLKFWFRLVTFEAYPTRWGETFENVRENGILGVQFGEIVREILVPILEPLLLVITVPYLIANGLFPLLGATLEGQSYFYRHIYFVILMACLCGKSISWLGEWWPKFKQSVIDEKFLIGQRLHNFNASVVSTDR